MIWTHNLSSVALDLGFFQIHWYGLAYLGAALGARYLVSLRRHRLNMSVQDTWDCMFWMVMGVLIGGRVGYMLFYQTGALLENPLRIFFLWQGGMSFHGGISGVIIATILFARSRKIHPFDLSDLLAYSVPPGLALGRLGNFINGELWGKPTDGSWGVIFPGSSDYLPRHPSQLYQFMLEGVLLFLILFLFTLKPKPRMAATGMFFVCYALFRIPIEFVRLPDTHIGYLAFGWLTMGQLLTIPIFFTGIVMLVYGWRKNMYPNYTVQSK